MNILRGKIEKKRPVFFRGNVFFSLVNKFIRHGFIVPESGLAAPLIPNPPDPVNYGTAVLIVGLIVGLRFRVLTPVGIDRSLKPLRRYGGMRHIKRIVRVQVDHMMIL